MIRLQDQIEVLTKENNELHAQLKSLDGEPEQKTPPPSSPGPVMPSLPQKIETH